MTIHGRLGSIGLLSVLVLLPASTQISLAQSGDAASGKDMLKVHHCGSCHPVGGSGGSSAPDLGLVAARNVSPAGLAATMWNHGPKMWQLMDEQNLTIPTISEFEIAHLYAYFYLRYFDPPGDAQRGEEVFQKNRCARCHFRTAQATVKGTGALVSSWVSMANRVDWVQQMWNHGAGMGREVERLGMDWPQFSLQEMVDLLTYLEELPELRMANPGLRMGDWSVGEQLFEERKCAECHTVGESVSGKVDLLEAARREPRLSGLAVEMWNHRPAMEAEARRRSLTLENLDGAEMEHLVAYLFKKGYFEAEGDAQRGAHLVQNRGCTSCHGQADSNAPKLGGFEEGYSAVRLV